MIKELSDKYDECLADGKIQFSEGDVDIHLAESMFETSKEEYHQVLEFERTHEKILNNFSVMFNTRYDIQRKLVHALALFDKLKPSDHQCVIAHLCSQHPEYDLDWETLETMRLLRNGVQYRGQRISKETWTSYKPKSEIYIRSLFTFVGKKFEE